MFYLDFITLSASVLHCMSQESPMVLIGADARKEMPSRSGTSFGGSPRPPSSFRLMHHEA